MCHKDHFARDRHTKEEISEAIRKLKSNHPSSLITIYDLDAIYNSEDEKRNKSNSDDGVQSVEGEGEVSYSSIVFDKREMHGT